MGVDFADYDNDGWPDLAVTDLSGQRYALYRNRHDGTFDYGAIQAASVVSPSLTRVGECDSSTTTTMDGRIF